MESATLYWPKQMKYNKKVPIGTFSYSLMVNVIAYSPNNVPLRDKVYVNE
ncbi:hypothetical protein BCF59_0079 [Mycoplasmopsis mustelae]|uniref:Uncharacterized protein n=1 Tax=Mycoplasmopsis mustelae TaxID=171289 RepID=A0A4R7UCH2_9BACT|nr:hypothetical protein BCF59_0079 [Mycoplasmopsis mustelae]